MQRILDRLTRLKEDNANLIKDAKSSIASYEKYIAEELERIQRYEEDMAMAEEAEVILKGAMNHPVDNYRNWQPTFARYTDKNAREYSIIGLAAEAGELLALVQKSIRKGEKINDAKVLDELGDVFWYVNAVMNTYKISWSELCDYNMKKLTERNNKK
jgi:NTP pyrophosphatase (non-canonical NTP hydrolase)